MAHYAILNNNVVVRVIVGIDEDDLTNLPEEYSSWEEYYSDVEGQTVKRTSYNSSIRNKFAGIGDTYDPDNDVFIPPKPYDNWILDETDWLWKAPVDLPSDHDTVAYNWDQETNDWISVDE